MKLHHRSIDTESYRMAALREENGFPTRPYCDTPFYYMDGHIDHIRPHSDGGKSSRKNLILVCKSCNKEKRDLGFMQWIRKKNLHSPEYYANLFTKYGKNLPPDLEAYMED